jgi:tetratricopeptide (TPR) repeat protein
MEWSMGVDLLGREAELATLRRAISTARNDGTVLLMVGDPGIGKSALLASVRHAGLDGGFNVLTAVGAEAETHLPFGALHQILTPLIDRSDALPRRQREALWTALGQFDGPAPDLFLIAEAALNLLTNASQERPVLVIADDVQWFDSQSDQILTFLAHRSTNPGLGIIAAARTGHDGAFIAARFPELAVGGVNDEAGLAILSRNAHDLAPADLRRVHREAQGNPLALLELPAVWGDGPATEDDPPTLSARLERAFGGRIADLPDATRDVLLVAATASLSDRDEILSAAALMRSGPAEGDPLAPAVSAGLIVVDDSLVRFRHPLMRSGVLQGESVVRRLAAHQALAEVVPTADPFRRTWHRAQSIIGPDDGVANELEAAVPEALRRGAIMTAVSILERAAQLSSSPALRGHRLLQAAEHAFAVGRPDVVGRLVADAAHIDLDALDRARVAWLNEILNDDVRADPARVLALCDHASSSAEAGETSLALSLLGAASLRCWWADTGADAQTRIVDVLDRIDYASADPRHLSALAITDPVGRASDVADRLGHIDLDAVADGAALRTYGMTAYAVGDFALATDLLDRAARLFREDGQLGLLPVVLALQLHLHLDLGDWSGAAAAAEEVTRVSIETGQSLFAFNNVLEESREMALRGDWRSALDLIEPTESHAARLHLNDALCLASQTRGAALLSAGRPDEAFAALKRSFDRADDAYHLRESFGGIALLTEAAVDAGRADEARAIVVVLEEVARSTPAPILHNNLLYARAVLAEDHAAEECFRRALDHDLVRWPWLKARIELEFGRWLVGSGRLDDASVYLQRALDVFERLGAARWIGRAQAALVDGYYAFQDPTAASEATQ